MCHAHLGIVYARVGHETTAQAKRFIRRLYWESTGGDFQGLEEFVSWESMEFENTVTP